MENSAMSELLINLLGAIAILVIGFWAAKRVKSLIQTQMVKRDIDAMLASFFSSIGHILFLAFIIIAALNQLGVQTTSLIAIIGAAGLAIGLALQDSLSNFAAGVMIIILRPFKTGDFIEAGGVSGVVEGIQIFSTQMRTGDNKTIIVPNASITGGSIINYSTKDTRRIDLVFGIGYDDDIKKAKQILEQIIAADERILKDPEAVVAVSELADSSVNFVVRPWVNSDDYWAVRFDLLETVKLKFDEEKISIPYPQTDVHLHQIA